MKSFLVHSVAIAVTIVVFVSAIHPSTALRLSDIKSLTGSKDEGRSLLLDLLLGLTSEESAPKPVKVSNSPSSGTIKNSPVLDLAQSLIGKDTNVNNNLYIKIFKFIFNLVMDVMMDRMDVNLRREDVQRSLFLDILRNKNIMLKRSPNFERPVERQQFSQHYFVE